MQNTALVIARAYQGQPLKRVAISSSDRLVYLTTPERAAASLAGEWEPMGFPKADVFIFDTMAYEKLAEQWAVECRTDSEVWRGLVHFGSFAK